MSWLLKASRFNNSDGTGTVVVRREHNVVATSPFSLAFNLGHTLLLSMTLESTRTVTHKLRVAVDLFLVSAVHASLEAFFCSIADCKSSDTKSNFVHK